MTGGRLIRLRSLIFLVILITTVLLTVGMTLQQTSSYRRIAYENLEARARLLADNFSTLAETPLLQETYSEAQNLVTEYVEDPSILTALVLRQDGLTVAHSNPELVGANRGELHNLDRFERAGEYWFRRTEREFAVSRSVEVVGIEYGRVFLTFDLRPIAREADALIMRSIGLGLLLLIVNLFVAYGLTYLLSREISDQIGGVEEIAQGSKATRVTPGRISELARLANSVNTMASKLLANETALTSANRELREAQQSKQQFISNMSHELQTPLNGIAGLTSLILSGENPPELDERVRAIKASGEYLARMIGDLLEYDRLITGEVEIQESAFELEDLLRTLEYMYREPMRLAGLEFDVVLGGETFQVIGDRDRITQVLSLLLSNAIKFSNDGTVTVECRCRESDLALTVSDTGIGIPREKLDEIFLPFRQLEETHSKTRRGLGLGLHLAGRIAEQCGGTISVESEVGRGSSFTLRIPVRPIEDAAAGETEVDFGNGERSVLVVEDEAINRLFLVAMLRQDGLDVAEAKDGEAAYALLESRSFDLVLMDIGLPKMNGRDVTRKVRAQSCGPNRTTPIIAVTAHSTEEDLRDCMEAGVDKVVTKPIKETQLRRTISSYLES